MADTYKCCLCGKVREGRFTRQLGESGQGWSQGHHLPRWYCFLCLPYGQGRGEDDEVEMAKRAVKTEVLPMKLDPAKAKEEGLKLYQPLQMQIEELDVRDDESYQLADFLLSKVGAARKTWAAKMEPIIRPMRQALDAVYALNREVDKPLEALEVAVKAKMIEFKREERRQLQEADRLKAQNEQRLRDEAAAAEARSKTAVTPQLRGRFTATAERLTQQAEIVAQQETVTPVQADRSSERVPKKARVVDIGLYLQGVLDGTIAAEAITVNQVWLNRQFKDDPEAAAAYPGVEVYEDIQIVRR